LISTQVVRLRAPPINQGNLRAAAPSFHAELELRGAHVTLGDDDVVVGVERLVFVVFRGMGALGGPRPVRLGRHDAAPRLGGARAAP